MAMAELKKMKVLPRRAPAPHHLKKLLFFKKYYRWALWLSLSLYFFYSSFLFPTPTAPAAPAAGAHRPPELGIYVYDLPPSYNRDWLAADGRCRSHLFAAEVAIHEALAGSPLAVSDPAEADFFLVPVYVSCNFSTANGFPSLSHARPLLRSAVHRVSALHPFWNRSSGRDHVFVASHDYGACFHAMEDAAVADGIPEFMRNSVLLQTFGVRSPHRCQEAEHVVIPPYVSPDVTEWAPRPEAVKRDIWVFFRGKMEVHPKNFSGRFYSNLTTQKSRKCEEGGECGSQWQQKQQIFSFTNPQLTRPSSAASSSTSPHSNSSPLATSPTAPPTAAITRGTTPPRSTATLRGLLVEFECESRQKRGLASAAPEEGSRLRREVVGVVEWDCGETKTIER